jgi:hypothetical protein
MEHASALSRSKPSAHAVTLSEAKGLEVFEFMRFFAVLRMTE